MTFRAPLFSPGSKSYTRVVEGPPRLQGSTLISEVSNPQRLTEWPLPKWPRQIERGGVSANLLMTLLLVVAPFSQTDWPLPKGGLRTADVPVIQNLQLTTLVPADGTPVFSPFDWPLPKRGLLTADVPVVQNLQLTTLVPDPAAALFPQFDWPLPKRGLHSADAPWVQNLQLTTLVPAADATLFPQLHWPLPQRQLAPQGANPPNLLLSTLAQPPFTQSDWKTVSYVRNLPTGEPQDLLLTTLALTEAPFSQYNWITSYRGLLPLSGDAQNLLETILAPTVAVPFSQTDWPKLLQKVILQQAPFVSPLYTTLSPAEAVNPFVKQDWYAQATARPATYEIPRNILISQLAIPFQQSYWYSQPRGVTPQQIEISNLLGTTLAPVVGDAPFRQAVWALPIRSTTWQGLVNIQVNLLETVLVPGVGSVVIFYNGVSMADGVTQHKGISQPTIILTDAGGGTYNVDKTHQVSGHFKADTVIEETYIIEGELP